MRRAGRLREGFTLVEVIVVTAIVAILVAVALPIYTSYVVRGKRSEAKSVLLQAAQLLERSYTQTGGYNNPATNAPYTALPAPLNQAPPSGPADYALSIAVSASPAGTAAQAYQLTAAPTGTFRDPQCGSLTLDNTGLQGATGTGLSATDCWQK